MDYVRVVARVSTYKTTKYSVFNGRLKSISGGQIRRLGKVWVDLSVNQMPYPLRMHQTM